MAAVLFNSSLLNRRNMAECASDGSEGDLLTAIETFVIR